MDHRLFAVLAIVSFALGGAGCASKSQRAPREQILMPLQTGSVLQRRVMIDSEIVEASPRNRKRRSRSVSHRSRLRRRQSRHRSGQRMNLSGGAPSRKERTGEGGIRTLGTLLGYGALAKRCFRPLSHLTNRVREYERGGCSSTMPGRNRGVRE